MTFKIKSIKFSNNDFEVVHPISNSIAMSLCDKEKLTMLVFLISNEDFMQEDTTAYKYLKAKRVIVEIEMISMQGKAYSEIITIEKMLIKDPEPTLNQPNIEMMLSATYQVNAETE